MKDNQNCYDEIKKAKTQLLDKTGIGSEWTGWLDRSDQLAEQEMMRIQKTAQQLNAISDYIIVIGIGGSYMGSKAVIDACIGVGPLQKHKILYAGHHMDSDYYTSLIDICDKCNYSLIVISKSGTTLEPKLAFDLLLDHAKQKYGDNHIERIVCITDEKTGVLRSIADKSGYTSFVIPNDIGGRYSVATAVGLLPMACAGLDIIRFLEGMKACKKMLQADTLNEEIQKVFEYISRRITHYRSGKKIECMANFSPSLTALCMRWQQLFGESEGKHGQGLFPVVLQYSTDLHSMGQYMQDGPRMMIETLLAPIDGDTEFDKANTACYAGTKESHEGGGVPTFTWNTERNDEFQLGFRMLTMMFACSVSCYLAGVHPFDQPGVEGYKQAMKKYMNEI